MISRPFLQCICMPAVGSIYSIWHSEIFLHSSLRVIVLLSRKTLSLCYEPSLGLLFYCFPGFFGIKVYFTMCSNSIVSLKVRVSGFTQQNKSSLEEPFSSRYHPYFDKLTSMYINIYLPIIVLRL